MESEDDAHAFIAAVRSRHHDARHNVPAWVLSDGRERCSDDGEPSRTAEPPCREFGNAGLADVCCGDALFGDVAVGVGRAHMRNNTDCSWIQREQLMLNGLILTLIFNCSHIRTLSQIRHMVS